MVEWRRRWIWNESFVDGFMWKTSEVPMIPHKLFAATSHILSLCIVDLSGASFLALQA